LADVFISYSSADREKVKELAETIQRHGWSVWWDRQIPFGKSFDQVIEQELDAARCVIVVWTKTSVASNWVKTEAAEGARRHILFPVFLDDIKIPLEFRRLQAANLTNWRPDSADPEFDRLLTYIQEMLGVPTMVRAEGADTDGPAPIRNSAARLESSQKAARQQNKRRVGTPPIDKPRASAERESEFEPTARESSQQREDHGAVGVVKGPGLPISRNALLILGGVVTLLILIIAFRPTGYTPSEGSQDEPVSAPVAANQPAREVASTSPPTGTTGRLVEQTSELIIPKRNQERLVAEPVTAGKDADARFAKGEQYYYGKGVPQNYAEAAKWYHKAADRDHPGAQQKLAQMYRDGVGVSKNEQEALKWEVKVLSHQQTESSKTLDEMHKKALDAIRSIKAD